MANLFCTRKDWRLVLIQPLTRPTFSNKKLSTNLNHTSRKQVYFKVNFQSHWNQIYLSILDLQSQGDDKQPTDVEKAEVSLPMGRDGRILNSNKWQIAFTLQEEDDCIVLTIKIAK